jgi:superfamily I DNA/RNA helicase
MALLRDLNPQQREAVTTIDGPVLVLSGAGTGKTRTITYRIAYMLQKGIAPENVLAVTFTNKAAREMAARVRQLVGKKAATMQVSTFHSFGLRVVREHAEKAGLRAHPSVYDTGDQVSIVRKALRSLSVSWKQYKPEEVLYRLNAARVPTKAGIEIEEADEVDAAVLRSVWEQYERTLRAANAVDFEDLLLLPLRLFRSHRKVLAAYRERFTHILVDEYQDTNALQFDLLHLLAQKHRNLCAVGDDDQSIYGWRGAEIRNILDFERHYRGAKVVRLEENYRSTPVILTAANAVIARNAERKAKRLWTRCPTGPLIRCMAAPDEMGEAELVVSDIMAHQRAHKRPYNHYAILMRMNTQARPFEDVLRRYRVPYVVVGGMQFYDRKEVRDFLAYLRLLVNPDDDEAFLRIANVPPRGVGDTSLEHVNSHAAGRKTSLCAGLESIGECGEIKPGPRAALAELYALLAEARGALESQRPSIVAGRLWDQLGYERELEGSSTRQEDIDARMANVQSLIDGIAWYEQQNPKATLGDYLRDVALGSDEDDEEMNGGKLPVMTVHSSKGLEFPSVYVVGVEQGIMPHAKSVVTEHGEAEERRLFYVAVTRAKQELTLTYAQVRMKYGHTEERQPSEFLKDIPENVMEWQLDAYNQVADEDESADYLEQMRAAFREVGQGDRRQESGDTGR